MSSLPDTGCLVAGACPLHLPLLTATPWDGIGPGRSASTIEHPFLDTYINNSRWEDTNEATPSCDEWAKAPAE